MQPALRRFRGSSFARRAHIVHNSAGNSPAVRALLPRPVTSSHTRLFSDAPKAKRSNLARCCMIATLFGATSLALVLNPHEVYAESRPSTKSRTIRLAEVRKHGKDAERVWVIKGLDVYDITEWIPNHPGGEVILRAAGGSIDQYWNIFSIHKKPEVYDILDQYKIGEIDERDLVDGQIPSDAVANPFDTDPARDERLQMHSERPCNAETPSTELTGYITPNEVFYVRNHLWVPKFDTVDGYTITVELPDGEEKIYTMKDIEERFEAHTITACLQCSGNRRKHMSESSGRPTQGLPWSVGAIGNAEWTGPLLRDVLSDAGFSVQDPPPDVKHVQFSGHEAYGASIPLEKAVHRLGDVILAYKMNGKALPRDHGYPVRIIVPGHVAARSVKWLNRIALSEDESPSQWQQRDYKCFGPYEDGHDVDWSAAPAIQELPVQSAFTRQQEGTTSDAETGVNIELQGYALSGGGKRVIRVDVSTDEGATWRAAELIGDAALGSKAWGWQRWRIAVPKSQAGQWLAVKAIDEAYQTQPETHGANWNFRGNLSTAWHRIERGSGE